MTKNLSSVLVLLVTGGAPSLGLAADPVILTAPLPTLAMNISLKPAAEAGDFDLRVSILPPVTAAPTVEFQDFDGGVVRQMLLGVDGDGWGTKIGDLPQVAVGAVYVTAIGDDVGAVPEMQTLRFATRGLPKAASGAAYSPDGQFGLFLEGSQLSANIQFLITTGDLVDPPLPVTLERVAGPFTVMVLPTDLADLDATVVVVLPSSTGTPPVYTVRWLDVSAKAWIALDPGPAPTNGRVAQAIMTHPGTFVLTRDVQ